MASAGQVDNGSNSATNEGRANSLMGEGDSGVSDGVPKRAGDAKDLDASPWYERERRISGNSVHSLGSSSAMRGESRDYYRAPPRGYSENYRSARPRRTSGLPSLAHDNFPLSMSFDSLPPQSRMSYVNRSNSITGAGKISETEDEVCQESPGKIGSKLESEPGPLTYVAAGTAPPSRLPPLKTIATTRSRVPAAVTNYIGPVQVNRSTPQEDYYEAPRPLQYPPRYEVHAPNSQAAESSGYYGPPAMSSSGRERDRQSDRRYRGSGGERERDARKHQRPYNGSGGGVHNVADGVVPQIPMPMTSQHFFQHQESENCRDSLMRLHIFAALQQQQLNSNSPPSLGESAPVRSVDVPVSLSGTETTVHQLTEQPTHAVPVPKESSAYPDRLSQSLPSSSSLARIADGIAGSRGSSEIAPPPGPSRRGSSSDVPTYVNPASVMSQQQMVAITQNPPPGFVGLYPNVVGQGARDGRRVPNAEFSGLSEEFLSNNFSMLMSIMTQNPPNHAIPNMGVPVSHGGNGNEHSDMANHHQQSAWQQMAHLSQDPSFASAMQAEYGARMVSESGMAEMVHPPSLMSARNMYPVEKRMRRASELDSRFRPELHGAPSHLHPSSHHRDTVVPSVPRSRADSVRSNASNNTVDLSDGYAALSNNGRKAAVTETELGRQSGESGYQSESTPPLPLDKTEVKGETRGEAESATPTVAGTRSDKKGCIWEAVPSGSATIVASTTKQQQQQGCVSQPAQSHPSHSLPPPLPSQSLRGPAPSSRPSFSGPPRAPPAGSVDADGKFNLSEMDVLSEQIWCYHNSVTQTEQTLNRKLHLRDMLYYAICPVFPMCGLYVVGSSLNGFGNNSSDMDLCLMITNKDLDQKTDAVVVLNMILSTLRQVEWVSHQQLILAKVPILRIKFAAPFADITVDLNANNSVAIRNTHLLCYYSSFDWRVRPLVTIVKEWAKRKGINDANRSSFTSYSLVLMVIHYLQCGAKPPVLPSLQSMYSRRFLSKADVRSLNVTHPLPPPDEWNYNDKATLGELLIGFLQYYASTFDYNRDAISVRMGRRVERAVVARKGPGGQYHHNGNNWRSQWRCICIEEPFTQSNTAHSIYDEMVFDAIKEAFQEAYNELEVSRDMQKLLTCTPIKAQPPNGGAMVFSTTYEPRSDHVLAVVAPRNGTGASGSTGSVHTARSGRSSCASSTSGGDNDSERLRESPLSQLMPPMHLNASTTTTNSPSSHRHNGGGGGNRSSPSHSGHRGGGSGGKRRGGRRGGGGGGGNGQRL